MTSLNQNTHALAEPRRRPDSTPVDRAAVLAYRDLVAPEIERLGA
ncbi:hypothetical protein [Nocardioides endophyticus]